MAASSLLRSGCGCASVNPMHTLAAPSHPDPVEAAILQLTAQRGPDKSICPSEVARALRPDWHALLPAVRQAAARLAAAGQIEILRHGRPVDPAAFKGVIRLRATRTAA